MHLASHTVDEYNALVVVSSNLLTALKNIMDYCLVDNVSVRHKTSLAGV
jgi:hypothetical protein